MLLETATFPWVNTNRYHKFLDNCQVVEIDITLCVVLQIPRAVIEPVLFASLVFGVAGLHGGFMGWLGFCFVCVLCANYANAYGECSILY